jgi:hypothetical protein
MKTLYIDNDTTVTLKNLKNSALDTYINDGTVTMTLKDSSGTTVSGMTFPLTMSYVASSNGDYLTTLQGALSLSEDTQYAGEITVVSGSLDAKWTIDFIAKKRKFDA